MVQESNRGATTAINLCLEFFFAAHLLKDSIQAKVLQGSYLGMGFC